MMRFRSWFSPPSFRSLSIPRKTRCKLSRLLLADRTPSNTDNQHSLRNGVCSRILSFSFSRPFCFRLLLDFTDQHRAVVLRRTGPIVPLSRLFLAVGADSPSRPKRRTRPKIQTIDIDVHNFALSAFAIDLQYVFLIYFPASPAMA